jgi:hypothetical protein
LAFAALLFIPITAFAQFAGSYVHRAPQGAVTLTLQQQGHAVRGSMQGLDGSQIEFEGVLRDNGKGVAGTARSPNGSGIFAARMSDGRLSLILAETDPATGRADVDNALELAFAPVQQRAPQGGQQQPATRPESAATPPQAPSSERDPALAGHWVYSSIYRSGEFSGTTTRQMAIHPDGTYRYGHGAVQVSDSNAFGRSQSDDFTAGQWRTKGRIVYINEGGSQWVPYARYYVEGGSLLLTFENGSKQLWRRR